MQGVIDTRVSKHNLYVEGTLLVFLGTLARCRTCFATVVYIWVALGLPLALKKAALETTVAWTSAVLKVTIFKNFSHKNFGRGQSQAIHSPEGAQFN